MVLSLALVVPYFILSQPICIPPKEYGLFYIHLEVSSEDFYPTYIVSTFLILLFPTSTHSPFVVILL